MFSADRIVQPPHPPRPQHRPPLRVGPSEGLFLAATPLVGYSYAWAYEAGVLSHYELPSNLVALTLTQVVVVWTLILLLTFWFGNFLIALPNRPWWVVVLRGLPILTLTYGGVLLLEARDEGFALRLVLLVFAIALFVLAAGIVLQDFVRPIGKRRDAGGWVERIAADFRADASAPRNVALDGLYNLLEKIGVTRRTAALYHLAVWAALMGGPFVFYLGRVLAWSDGKFTVRITAPECAVVRVYGSTGICVTFDREHKTLGPTYSVVSLVESSAGAAIYRLEFTGRLKVARPFSPDPEPKERAAPNSQTLKPPPPTKADSKKTSVLRKPTNRP